MTSSPAASGKPCHECGRLAPTRNRGRCLACYSRLRRRMIREGTWDTRTTLQHRGSVAERLMARVNIAADGCWHYDGYINDRGYGLILVDRRSTTVHRAAYAAFVGPIPPGLDVDHLCHNRDGGCGGGFTCLHRRCFNPDHLGVATRGVNARRSRHTIQTKFAARTSCNYGHPFSESNTLWVTDSRHVRPYRRCKTCSRERARLKRWAAK